MKSSKICTTLILISLLFLNGCVLPKYALNSDSIDLSKFDKEGIFVTTGDLTQKYKSVSILFTTCYNGYTPKESYKEKAESKSKNKENFDVVYTTEGYSASDKSKNFDYKPCILDDLFAEIISEAKSKGANGIIKLEIRNVSRENGSQTGLEIVGLAIKIIEE